MAHGRSDLETAITGYLAVHGWNPPSLRVQATAFPGATPAANSDGGKGRGAIVFDLEKADTGGILMSYCVGLKATAGDRPDTIAVTTGTEEHAERVVLACRGGLDVPIVAVRLINPSIVDGILRGFEEGEATCVRFGAMLRAHGLVERTKGQGKGRGCAAPVSWGRKTQTAKSGKAYVYVTLQANLRACDATWEDLIDPSDLAEMIADNAEGILL